MFKPKVRLRMPVKIYGSGENQIITADPNMHDLIGKLEIAAGKDTTINLLGPTGTGKGTLARYIHSISRRQDGPFVEINCAAFPETLIESELFGYVKGAFTGAISDKPGALEKANGGTFFMDEKDKMSLGAQWKLLKALEDGYQRVGSHDYEVIHPDIRIITASSVSPEEAREDEEHHFSEGLHYRLGGVYIELPPLTERGKKDIEALANHYCEIYSREYNTPVFVGDDVLEFLYAYHWPGNVRELKNCMDGAVALSKVDPESDPEPLKIEDVEDALRREVLGLEGIFPTSSEKPVSRIGTLKHMQNVYILHAYNVCNGSADKTAKKLRIGRVTIYRKLEQAPGPDELVSLEEMGKNYILRVLAECDGNQTETAKRLGIGRNTLWRKLKKYGVEPENS